MNLVPVCTISEKHKTVPSHVDQFGHSLGRVDRTPIHKKQLGIAGPSSSHRRRDQTSSHRRVTYTSSNPSHPSRVLTTLHLTLFLPILLVLQVIQPRWWGEKKSGCNFWLQSLQVAMGLAFNLPTTSIDANLLRLCKRCVAQHCCCSLWGIQGDGSQSMYQCSKGPNKLVVSKILKYVSNSNIL